MAARPFLESVRGFLPHFARADQPIRLHDCQPAGFNYAPISGGASMAARAQVARTTAPVRGSVRLLASRVIALDVLGRSLSTEDMANTLRDWHVDGRPAALLIGGPEGLSRAALDRADEKWSLSRLTLPHPLVRIVIAEQLYRAWSLLKGHPYHR